MFVQLKKNNTGFDFSFEKLLHLPCFKCDKRNLWNFSVIRKKKSNYKGKNKQQFLGSKLFGHKEEYFTSSLRTSTNFWNLVFYECHTLCTHTFVSMRIFISSATGLQSRCSAVPTFLWGELGRTLWRINMFFLHFSFSQSSVAIRQFTLTVLTGTHFWLICLEILGT